MSRGQWILVLALAGFSAIILMVLVYFQLKVWLFVFGLVYGLFGLWYSGGLNGRSRAEGDPYRAESFEAYGIFLAGLTFFLVAGFLGITFGFSLATYAIMAVSGLFFLEIHYYTKRVALRDLVPPASP